MPKLVEIVNEINIHFKTNVLNAEKFQGGKLYGIAELIEREGPDGVEAVPMVVAQDGEGTSVIINDNYPLQIYHRVESVDVTEEDRNEGFGSEQNKFEIASMVMVCICDTERLQINKYDLVSGLSLRMPKNVASQDQSIQNTVIDQGEIDTVSQEVFRREYPHLEDMPPPQIVMFSISYQITTEVKPSCFNLC